MGRLLDIVWGTPVPDHGDAKRAKLRTCHVDVRRPSFSRNRSRRSVCERGEPLATAGPHIEKIRCLARMLFDDLLEIPGRRMSRDSIAEPAEVPALDRRGLGFSQKLVEVDH